MRGRNCMAGAFASAMAFAVSGLAAAKDRDPAERPPFCAVEQKHRVADAAGDPGAVPPGKARVYVFWDAASWRWLRRQCKVALNGEWVAVLTPNTYSVVDANPGTLKFCAAGGRLEPTWRSLMFLHAKAGATYYIECHPGSDNLGATEPSLFEPDPQLGRKAVSKHRFVTFRVEPER